MAESVRTADAVIIGGGVMGSSIAYALTQQGMRNVVLLEKNYLGSGSSGKSGAIVRTHYSTAITARIALKSLETFSHFAERIGGNAGFVQTGMLIVASAADQHALQHKVDFLVGLGINKRKRPMPIPFSIVLPTPRVSMSQWASVVTVLNSPQRSAR